MNDAPNPSPAPERAAGIKGILLEALLVAVVGAGFAFAANQVSPRGLTLSWNYFGGTNGAVPKPINATLPSEATRTNPPSPAELLMSQLQKEGLQWVNATQALALAHDPRLTQGKLVFIDARNDEEYQGGHVAGAYMFDVYNSNPKIIDQYQLDLSPICRAAEQVVVYCHSADCDAAELAANKLREAGVPAEKLFVYVGGISEWNSNSWPVEIGARNSGNLRNTSK